MSLLIKELFWTSVCVVSQSLETPVRAFKFMHVFEHELSCSSMRVRAYVCAYVCVYVSVFSKSMMLGQSSRFDDALINLSFSYRCNSFGRNILKTSTVVVHCSFKPAQL